MRLHRIIVGAAIVAIGLSEAKTVSACECAKTNVCQVFSDADAVFVGTIQTMTETTSEMIGATLQGKEVRQVIPEIEGRFQIEKAYKGLLADQKTVDVRTSSGCCACGVDFKVGDAYVVYAYRDKEGQLHTSFCSRTQRLSDAADDIRLMENYIAGKKLSAIIGYVSITSDRNRTSEWLDPSRGEGIAIEVQGAGKTYRTTADEKGMFRVWNVTEGKYIVRALVDSAYNQFSSTQRVSIEPGACSADAYRFLKSTGVIRGNVRRADGTPTETGTEISVLNAEQNSGKMIAISTLTGAGGKFEFSDLPPGLYVVAVGGVFYGGGSDRSRARIIDLRKKATVGNINIRLGK